MLIRFEFRKAVGKKAVPGHGTLAVVLRFPLAGAGGISKTYAEYGPYNTPIQAQKIVWESRRSVRPKADIADAVRELNRQVSSYQNDLEESHAELSRQNREMTTPALIDGPGVLNMLRRLQAGPFVPVTLPDVYRQFMAARQTLVQQNRKTRTPDQIAESTYKSYPKRWVLIQQFLQSRKTPRLPVASVSYKITTDLLEWLRRQPKSRAGDGPYAPASIKKVIDLMKALLTYAQSKEYIPVSPIAKFSVRGGSSKPNPKPLTEAQMCHLETCELPPVLRFQCDSWLVAAELCLHYVDYMQLPQMPTEQAKSGTTYIVHERGKQNAPHLVQTVNVTERAERILSKYGGPENLYYTSSAYFSKILKKVARMADLRDETGRIMALQFGQGRDTGLTQRATLGAGELPLASIAGWSNTKPAKHYIKRSVELVDNYARTLQKEE